MFELLKTKVSEYSKKYQIDLAYVIKNEFWVYLRLGTSLITGLAVSVVFARLASKEVFGQFNFILAILAIVSIASMPGLNAAILRSTARGNEGNYKQAVNKRFLWSLLGIPALLGVGAYYYYYDTQIIGICLMISSIFFPFVFAPNTWDSFLAGKKRFDLTARYGMVQSSISAAAILGILFLNANHLILILAIHLIITSLLACLLYWRSLKYIENQSKDDECQKYGYFLTGISIVGTVATHIDKIMIGTLLGTSQLAIYAIALVIPTRIKELSKVVWAPFMPKFSQDGIEVGQVLEKLKSFLLPLTLLVLAGSALYLLFIDDILLLLFSEKYVDSIIYAKILLLMILLTIPDGLLGTFIMAKKNVKAIILANYVSPFLGIAIICGFIYVWGIMGAVWGLIAGRAIRILFILAGIGSEERQLE